MGNVNATIAADMKAEAKGAPKQEGTLKSEGKEHTVFAYADTESVSEAASELLEQINDPEMPEKLLGEHEFMEITSETIEIEQEIEQLSKELEKPADKAPEGLKQGQARPQGDVVREQPEVHTSIFSLARSFNSQLTQGKKENARPHTSKGREEGRAAQPLAYQQAESLETLHLGETKEERDEEQREGFDQQQQKQEDKRKYFEVKGSRRVSRSQRTSGARGESLPVSMEGIYTRFMALMARILGQAEAEAHALYQRIKHRTDSIDVLTLLISKINSEPGKIDWSDNEEMKKLIAAARAMGVDIPEGKLEWSDDEKKLLKENIQMRKDSMEKVTQLERTDMQRYLQEASQCHQARSNVLKLLKEVMDTIIHNMRGG